MLKVLTHDLHGRHVSYEMQEINKLIGQGWKIDDALTEEMATGKKPEKATVEPIRKTLSLRK